jgi:hypothetical protein
VIFSGFFTAHPTLSAKHEKGTKKGAKNVAKMGQKGCKKVIKKGCCEQPQCDEEKAEEVKVVFMS